MTLGKLHGSNCMRFLAMFITPVGQWFHSINKLCRYWNQSRQNLPHD